jgi:hypothetical protein
MGEKNVGRLAGWLAEMVVAQLVGNVVTQAGCPAEMDAEYQAYQAGAR